jgi:hypothetical protein
VADARFPGRLDSHRDTFARRAPRLGPDQLIAPHITRLGRWRKRDPRKAQKLPSMPKVLGVLAWAVFLEETVRRARRAVRQEAAETG